MSKNKGERKSRNGRENLPKETINEDTEQLKTRHYKDGGRNLLSAETRRTLGFWKEQDRQIEKDVLADHKDAGTGPFAAAS